MSTKPLACKNALNDDRAALYDILVSRLTDTAVFLMDFEGCLATWNPGVEKILGYAEFEWLDRPADLTFTEEDRASRKLEDDLAEALKVGQSTKSSWQVRRDGSLIFVKETLVALRDGAGTLLGFSKLMHDLTAHVHHEEDLEGASSYAEGTFDTLRQPVLVLDEKLHVRSANSAFCRVFRNTRGQTEGRSIYSLANGDWDFPQLHLLLESVLPILSRIEDFEFEHTFGELGRRVLLLNGRKLVPDDGQAALTVLAIADITLRKQAEWALVHRAEKDRLVAAAVPAILGYAGPDFRFSLINTAYERWFEVVLSDLIGRPISALFGVSVPVSAQQRPEAVQNGKVTAFQEDYCSSDGQRTLQVTYTPDINAAGVLQGFVLLGSDVTSRKQVEVALRRTEERWRGLFESMAEGFFVAELISGGGGKPADFVFVEVNPAFENITGLHEAVGKTFRERIPGIQDSLIERFCQVVETGEPSHFEVLVPAMRDSWYEVRAYRAALNAVAVLFLDVTERKAVDAQLRENEQRQAALVTLGDRLRDLHDIAALTSAAMEIVGTTLSLARAGYGRVDASEQFLTIESDWTDGRVPSLAGTYRFTDFGQDLKETFQRGESFIAPDVTTHPMTVRDSARWQALGIGSVINLPLFENGRFVALLFIQDIAPRIWKDSDLSFLRKVADRTWAAAERSRALRELQESESFTRSVLSSSPDCLTVMDLEGRLLTINEGGCMQMEIDDHAIFLNRPWLDFWTEPGEAADALAKAKKGLTQRFEGFCPTAKQTPKWWEVVVSPIRDASAETVRILALSRDITQRKAAEQERERLTLELQRSNEDLSQFAHTVAHDLQAPLRGVTVFAQLLHRNGAERLTGQDAEFLEHIVTSARRMAELVQGLLRFAQVGQGNIDQKPVPMAGTVEAALLSLQSQIDEQAAIIRYGELPTVMGDAVQLSQLLQNLVGNAVKYHRSGVPPEVSIGATREGGYYRFTVRDNGEGIAPEHLKIVFEPLKRFHGGDVPGSGLGLAVCQRIVTRHGGSIWVESSLASGSCFYFTLPAA